ncbi:hypothetical protein KIAC18_003979 [Sporomusa sphaeroides]|uniref:hypothetical protein n=1 Tax=Sporomusa sphaeroides TaxID=47679 RepID=UPI003DA00E1A
MNLDTMISDYIKRARFEHCTADMVKKDIAEGISIVTDDGFLVMNIFDNELHVVHCYAKPAAQTLFKDFVTITDLTAKRFGCKVILFTTRRPKAFEKVLGPQGYSPYAIVFAKQV